MRQLTGYYRVWFLALFNSTIARCVRDTRSILWNFQRLVTLLLAVLGRIYTRQQELYIIKNYIIIMYIYIYLSLAAIKSGLIFADDT